MRSMILFALLTFLSFSSFGQELKDIDEVAPFSDGLAAVRVGNQWGFINEEGELVIDFRDDLVWNKLADKERKGIEAIRYPAFRDGLCMIREMLEEEEIYVYGFIDKTGTTRIKPEYLNVTEFDQGYAVGILMTKTFRGKNNFQLNIYDYKFSEVILDQKGDIMRLLAKRDNILMSKRRYELPELRAKLLSKNLAAVKKGDNWELMKLDLE
ncbi:WG repeat-containing protein [Lentiprolixibacter aurantiacus]|uniref:WG repeat-containing protein n=1 Tax=Lentiprolixibacter aurantiacus TaxID=2993939 RepID=A0AAE3MMZ3_9FLAO|nr:WG repeat-containing protein [Lentiprolixibacter aurantiacus]MCX2720755.1 WG repeat-containing protein [Lentiprolixibacter aurantiacus]